MGSTFIIHTALKSQSESAAPIPPFFAIRIRLVIGMSDRCFRKQRE